MKTGSFLPKEGRNVLIYPEEDGNFFLFSMQKKLLPKECGLSDP
jgi:hypothetical protein